MSKRVLRRLEVQAPDGDEATLGGRVLGRVLRGGNFTWIAEHYGVSRQYLSRVFWQEVERRHPEVLARWGEGKPPLSWLRKELKG